MDSVKQMIKDLWFIAIMAAFLVFAGVKSCSTDAIEASLGCVNARTAKFPTLEELSNPSLQEACAARAYAEDNHSVWLVWSTAAAQEGETPAEWWIRTRIQGEWINRVKAE